MTPMCIDCFIKYVKPHEAELMNIKQFENADECPVCGKYGFLTSGVDEYRLNIYRDYFMKKFADEDKCVNLSFEKLRRSCRSRHLFSYNHRKGFVFLCENKDLNNFKLEDQECNKVNCPLFNGR